MQDAAGKLERRKALQHCFGIQEERVRRLRLLESAQRKLLPNGWREVLVLAQIAEKIEESEIDAQRASSQVPDGTVIPEEQCSPTGAVIHLSRQEASLQEGSVEMSKMGEQLAQLDPIDRSLIREASEKIVVLIELEKEQIAYEKWGKPFKEVERELHEEAARRVQEPLKLSSKNESVWDVTNNRNCPPGNRPTET